VHEIDKTASSSDLIESIKNYAVVQKLIGYDALRSDLALHGALGAVGGIVPRGVAQMALQVVAKGGVLDSVTDSALRLCIASEVGKENLMSVTQQDLKSITWLNCDDWGIQSLAGIGLLTNLEVLDVSSNEISDLSSLSGLNQLFFLDVSKNRVSRLTGWSSKNPNEISVIAAGNCIADRTQLFDPGNLKLSSVDYARFHQFVDCDKKDADVLYFAPIKGNEALPSVSFWYRTTYNPFAKCEIDWGDGTKVAATCDAKLYKASHTYAKQTQVTASFLVNGFPKKEVELAVAATPTTGKLPDTGITSSQCYAAGSDTLVSCTSAAAIALNPKQDGMVGRDVTSPSNTDGKLGFSYSTVGIYSKEECVKDNITGLIWEGKPTTGLRAAGNSYTNLGDNSANDASTYVSAVNAAKLCGYSDWRLPTADELQGLVDYSVAYPRPTIDATWFPNTQQYAYWTGTRYASDARFAWAVDFDYGFVYNGHNRYYYASSHVRLVR
jgi:hypothetical protein